MEVVGGSRPQREQSRIAALGGGDEASNVEYK